MKEIAIIGAGAAGLMTAASILENTEGKNYHIHLFEKNTTPGRKVLISGGGRCNVTTGITEKKLLLSKYIRGKEFIKVALGKFSPKKCREWFESHGVPLKCEDDLRVFPESDNGGDIVGVFEDIFKAYKDRITLHYAEGVSEIRSSSCNYTILTQKGAYIADYTVVTTGGNAYSHTGSTGDGYAFARAVGHTVTKLGPSLSSFMTQETWIHECSGISFPQAKVKIHDYTLSGAILLTHFGISGPLAFVASGHVPYDVIDSTHRLPILLAPIADMIETEWNIALQKLFTLHPKRSLTNILDIFLPRRFVEGFLTKFFNPLKDIYPASIRRKDREDIAELLGSGFPLILIARCPGDEFVTAGGVNTDEIDKETMESKIIPKLFFAGEVLDVDGVTGGFNLQACWASGYLTGKNIADKLGSNM